MHISKVNGKYPVAFKPNNIILRTKNQCSALEHQLLMVLFVVPATSYPEDRTVSIDIDLIIDKPLKGSVYNSLNKALNNAFDARFEIITDSTHFELIHVFSKIKRDGNIITATIDQFAIDEIKKQLPNGFTKIPIEYTIKFTTAYQFVFLEYFLKYKGNKKYAIDIEEIKRRAGIPKNKYPRWIHFNQRIAYPSIRNLMKVLGSDIECDIIKTGKKVTAITMSESKKRKLPKKNRTKHMNEQTKEDDAFNFALECFKLFPTEEKEKYKKEMPEYIGDTIALSTAVNIFSKQYSKLLEAAESPEEFLKLKDADY